MHTCVFVRVWAAAVLLCQSASLDIVIDPCLPHFGDHQLDFEAGEPSAEAGDHQPRPATISPGQRPSAQAGDHQPRPATISPGLRPSTSNQHDGQISVTSHGSPNHPPTSRRHCHPHFCRTGCRSKPRSSQASLR